MSIQYGQSVAADSAHPLLLNGSDRIWLVEQGGVDLFTVPLVAGEPAGAREHICRLGPGQILYGLGDAGGTADTGLLAVGLPQTRLACVNMPRTALFADPAERETVAAWLDSWLSALCAAMQGQPPRLYRDAAGGAPISIVPDENLYARGEVVWLTASAAGLIWMPARQALPAAAPFAITPGTWVSAGAQIEVACHSTVELARAGGLDAGLIAFHRAFLDHLRQRRETQEELARQRLARKHQADDQRFGDALAGLNRVLSAEEQSVLAVAGGDDALSAACGLVLEASGIKAHLREPASAAAASPDVGTRIAHIAHQSSASLRQVRLSGECWWREDVGPLLAFRSADGSPVALLPAGGAGYLLADPVSGVRAPLDAASAAALDDGALMFFRTFPEKAIGIPDLLRFGLVGAGPDVARLLLFGMLGGLLGLFTPFATGLLIDSVIPLAQREELVQLVLLLLTAAVGASAFELTRAIAVLRIDGRIGNATQSAIIHRLLHLPAPFFRDYSAGDLAQRAFGIASILQLLSNTTQVALLSWIFGLFSYVYLFFISWQLALLATALVAIALLLTAALNFWRLNIEREMFGVQGRIASRVFQILTGIGKIRASGAEKRAFALWAADFSRQKTLSFKTRRISNGLTVFDAGYGVLSSLLLFAAVAAFLPELGTGSFVAFNTAFTQFFIATIAMTGALTSSLNVIPLYERARPILEALPEASDTQKARGELSGAIDISHVTFRYAEDGPAILDDVSISIAPGEFVAIVGPSGSGKSTLFRLLLGFEQPQAGVVYYDDQNLAGLDIGAVRRQLGVVLQNGKLMPGDIFTNIVGSSPLTLEDAWEAARIAGLDQDIEAMPMGMHTLVAEGAGSISGGQKQRLMVARGIVKKPRILLFDEATSALDNQTQGTVARSIERLNATRLVIAHRLSTIIQADRIIVIEAGQVAESGSYAKLMAKNGRFAELAKRQMT